MSRRKDGLCSTLLCRAVLTPTEHTYCRACLARKLALRTQDPPLPCLDCGVEPRAKSQCYCRGCKAARTRAYRAQPTVFVRRKRDSDFCNCGDKSCSGLTCNFMRQVA